jgi:hypothetical protein
VSLPRLEIGILALCLATGCAPVKRDLTALYAHQPRSIVVVPAVNETVEVSAPSVFITTVTRPLAERGYYVFPVYLTDLILKDLGLAEAGHIHLLPPERFHEVFGADAVLLIIIKDWSTKYLVVASTVNVRMEYVLKDTRSGTILWRMDKFVSQGSGGRDPISALVAAAVHALFTDYLPLARQANEQVFQPPWGLPAGPYHPEYKLDGRKFE